MTHFVADAASAGGSDPPPSRCTPRRNRHRSDQWRAPVGRQLCQREGTGPRAACIPGCLVISLAPGTKVYLASKPVSMRLGFDGLAALVRPLFAVEP